MSFAPMEPREAAHFRALLEPDVPPELEALLPGYRPFTGASHEILRKTGNEWLSRRSRKQEMENQHFATLAWLFVHGAPLTHVRSVAWEPEAFQFAVLEWDAVPGIGPAEIEMAAACIEHSLNLLGWANFYEVEDKPGGGKGDAPRGTLIDPIWVAAYATALAKSLRRSPEWILWNARIDRALIYHQSYLRAEDFWTVLPLPVNAPATEDEIDRLLAAGADIAEEAPAYDLPAF